MKSNIDTLCADGINFSCLLCPCRQRLQKICTSSTVAFLEYFDYSSVDAAKDYIEEVCGDLEGAERALYFWENSGIAEKMKEKEDDKLMKEKLSSMSDAQKEHYLSQKQYDADDKFIKDNNYFL